MYDKEYAPKSDPIAEHLEKCEGDRHCHECVHFTRYEIGNKCKESFYTVPRKALNTVPGEALNNKNYTCWATLGGGKGCVYFKKRSDPTTGIHHFEVESDLNDDCYYDDVGEEVKEVKQARDGSQEYVPRPESEYEPTITPEVKLTEEQKLCNENIRLQQEKEVEKEEMDVNKNEASTIDEKIEDLEERIAEKRKKIKELSRYWKYDDDFNKYIFKKEHILRKERRIIKELKKWFKYYPISDYLKKVMKDRNTWSFLERYFTLCKEYDKEYELQQKQAKYEELKETCRVVICSPKRNNCVCGYKWKHKRNEKFCPRCGEER